MAPSSPSLLPFHLEDFFDVYEHHPDLLNLASSDAQPWTLSDLRKKGIGEVQSFHYPDVRKLLYPSLEAFCKPPAGTSVLPTSGASEAISLLLVEMFEKQASRQHRPIGVPSPSYGAFRGWAALLGLPIETYQYRNSEDWQPDEEQLIELSTRCAALIVTNPHNPTGQVMDRAFLDLLSQNISSRGGTLLIDEVFRVAGETESGIGIENAVVLASLSKTYGLPGLRLGWIWAADKAIVRLRTVQQYLTLSLSSMTVAMGAEILDRHQQFSRVSLIHNNRALVEKWAREHADKVSISTPRGGTTVCLTIHSEHDEISLFNKFIEHNVLLAPGGKCFDFPLKSPWFRLGYGTDTATLQLGLERVAEVIQAL